MRSESEVTRAIEKYSDTVRRICMIHLKNYADTQDIFQNVFLKYLTSDISFENDEHEKAWFIRVTVNACKDLLKSFFRSKSVPLEDIYAHSVDFTPQQSEFLNAVLALPKKYRDVIYLVYYEGYSAVEVAKILNKNVNTVYTAINRGKKLLKTALGGGEDEE